MRSRRSGTQGARWRQGLARTWALAIGAVVLGGVVLACSGDDDSDANGGDPADTATAMPDDPLAGEAPEVTLELELRDIAFSVEELRAPAGAVVELLLDNVGVLEHDFTIEEFAGEASAIARSDPDRFDVHVPVDRRSEARLLLRVAEPREYVFFCAVPGHRQAGMEGRLVIE